MQNSMPKEPTSAVMEEDKTQDLTNDIDLNVLCIIALAKVYLDKKSIK